MPGSNQFDEVIPLVGGILVDSSAGTAYQAAWPQMGTGHTRVDAIICMTDSAVDLVVELGLYFGADELNSNPVARGTIPAGAGMGTVRSVDLLVACLPENVSGFVVPLGFSLSVKAAVALAAGKSLWVTLLGGNL